MITIDYQFTNLEGRSFPIPLVKDKDQGDNPTNVLATVEIDLSEQTWGQVSLSSGFLSPKVHVAELQLHIDPYAIGSMNGTVTQIIIR